MLATGARGCENLSSCPCFAADHNFTAFLVAGAAGAGAGGDADHSKYSVEVSCSAGVEAVNLTKDEVKELMQGGGKDWEEVLLAGMDGDPMKAYMDAVISQLVGEGEDEMQWPTPKAVQVQVLGPQMASITQ